MTQTIEQVAHSVVDIVRKTEYPALKDNQRLEHQMPHVIRWQDNRIKELECEVKRLEHVVGSLQYAIQFAAKASEGIMDNTRVRDGKVEVFFMGEWQSILWAGAKDDEDAEAI